MDAASIVGAAMTAAKGAWVIYTLCHEAKHVNQTVRDLAKEAQAVGDACETVAKRLESIVNEADTTDSPSDKMRQLLGSRIDECQETVSQLMSSLQGLDNGSLNFLEKLGKQIRLNFRAADIAEARSQLRSHTDSLQLILQVLSIEVSYLLPRKADQYLCTLIAKVEQQMEHLLAAKSEDTTTESLKQNELLTYSKELIVHADDLYRESQANGSVGPPPTEERIREIEGWIREVSEPTGVLNVEMNQDQLSFSGGDRILIDEDIRVKRSRNSIIDVSLQTALAEAALNEAGSAYRKRDFNECLSHLQERSKLISTLPEEETIRCNTEESEFRLVLALESLKAAKRTFTISGFSDTLKHLDEAAELIRPIPIELRDKYNIEEGLVRADIAKLSLRSASTSFAEGNFEYAKQCFYDFDQVRAPLTAPLLEQLDDEECSIRMEIAQNALDSAKKDFEGGHIDKCWSIFRARSEVVNGLPLTEKTTCKDKEYQFLRALARETLDLAQKSITAEDFAECLRHLQLREDILRRSPLEPTDDSDTLKPIYFRAICTASTASSKSRDEHVAALLRAVEAYESKMPNLTEELQTDLHSLSFMLSQLYLRAADFDEAYHYCSVALTGHRKILGAAHERAVYCHALMVRISELKGEHMMATYHKTLIQAHLELPTVKEMLSLEVDSLRSEEPREQIVISAEPQSEQLLPKLSSVPTLPHTIFEEQTSKLAKHPSQRWLLSRIQQPPNNKISSVASVRPKQRLTIQSLSSPVKGNPSPLEAPSSIILHCELGRVRIKKETKLPNVGWIATDKQRGDVLANEYWNELVEATKRPRVDYLSLLFSQHNTGKGHLTYIPRIDLQLWTYGAIVSKTYLTLSPGHVRILSPEQIEWASVAGGAETDVVLKKIDSAVNGGLLKKPKVVEVTRVEFQYSEN